ncbi:hypothetical protein BHU72_00765 [Desulfuribacillus stibiiarsenatis]|uniref:Uncharacterized protein n=1 Tax=Desulfuribacillus stibiiarsenatis TaxID=1390249 RepID=A0A1E5L9N0_9FIRM|nr:hypothetical protein BHU72_00765 [Desulfuribacillus stibiiarsenatis]
MGLRKELDCKKKKSNEIKQDNNSNNNGNSNTLSPASMLVILAVLSGSLTVDSISIDKDKTVQVLLAGSLRRKTELDKMLDAIGEMPFETVLKAMMSKI